jgi:O-antigen/teichoic acid export membrane protein
LNSKQIRLLDGVSKPQSTLSLGRPDVGAQLAKNTGAILIGRALAILFSVGAAILLARYLGDEKLGQFASIYAYLALFSWMATFGFEPVLVREISRERDNASSLIHTTVVLSYFLAISTVGLALLLSPLAGYTGFLRKLLVLAALEFIFIPIRVPGVIFQVDMRQWYGSAINVLRQGLWLAIVVFFWLAKASLVYVILGRASCALVEAILMGAFGHRFLAPRKTFLWNQARKLLSHSFPLAFTSFVATIYLRIDQVMLHKMASDAVLGQYAAAVKISELFELLPAALMSSLAPILSVVCQQVEFRKYLDLSFRYIMIFAAALCVFMTVGSKTIIWLMYGNQFSPAAPLLAVLIWSEISVFFATVIVNAMIAQNLQGLLPWPTALGAGLNIALNVALIPRYSALGAAWATLASYTVAWMLFLIFLTKTRELMWQGLRFAIPVTAIAVGAVGTVKVLRVSESIGVVLAIAMFGVGLCVARIVRLSDLANLHEIVSRRRTVISHS